MSIQCKYVNVNALFSKSPNRDWVLRARAFGGAVEPSMTHEGNSPIFKQPVDKKKRVVGNGGFGGVAERIGNRRRRGTAIIIQDYAACCFRPATSTGSDRLGFFLSFFLFFWSELAREPPDHSHKIQSVTRWLHLEERGAAAAASTSASLTQCSDSSTAAAR